MGALRDLIERVDGHRDSLASRLGGGGQAMPDVSLPGLLEAMALGQRAAPGQALPVRAVNREEIIAMLGALAERQGAPVTPTEAREVVELLSTGELFADLGEGLAAALRLGRQAPSALVEDALALPELPAELVAAIRRDMRDDPSASPRDVLAGLGAGRLDRRLFTNTLRVLLGAAAPAALAETVRTLIAPENRTFRLAIIVYARLHGVDIDVEDLDAVHRAIDPAAPDLSPLFARGLVRIREKYARAEDALAVLHRLSAAR
jgi:hypothetical protein